MANVFDQFDSAEHQPLQVTSDPYWVQVNNALRSGRNPQDVVDDIAEKVGASKQVADMAATGMEPIDILAQLEQPFGQKFKVGEKSAAQIEHEAAAKAWEDQPAIGVDGMHLTGKGLAATGAGLSRLTRGAAQLVGAADQEQVDIASARDKAMAEMPGAKVGMAVGEALPVTAATLPAAPAIAAWTVPGRLAAGAGIGAAAGAEEPVATGDSRVTNTLVGGAGGLAGGAAGEAIGRILARVVPAVTAAVRGGQPVNVESVAASEAANAGIDWQKLDQAHKSAIMQSVRNALAQGGDTAVPDALARSARAAQLEHPVQLTKGLATRDLGQQVEEENLRHLSPELEAAYNERQSALLRNLQLLTEGGETMPDAAGASIKEMAGSKLAATKAAVRGAYKAAEDEAGANVVRPAAFTKWLWDNRHKPGMTTIINEARDVGAIVDGPNGTFAPGKVALKDLYQVRSTASKLAKDPSSAGKFATDAKTEIDKVFDDAGGSAYAKAAAMRRAQSAQFDPNERRIPGMLTGNRGQEAVVADEHVMDRLLSASVKQLNDFRRMAVSGNEKMLALVFKDPALRRQGINALKDMKSQTAQWLINKAGGDNGFSSAQFVAAYRSLGGRGKDVRLADQKFRALMGEKAAAELKRIYLVAKDATYDPEALAKGSSRHNTLIAKRAMSALSEMAKSAARVVPAIGPGAVDVLERGAASQAGKQIARFSPQQLVTDEVLRQELPKGVVLGQGLGAFGVRSQ